MIASCPRLSQTFLIGILLLAAGAAAASDEKISLIRVAENAAPVIEIVGRWNTGCPPLLQDVQQAGREITVTARTDSKRCTGEPGPYRLLVDLPDAAQADEREGVWRLRYELRDDPLADPALLAFELKSLGEPGIIDPETGFWWGESGAEFDHAAPGISAQLERQAGMLALTFSGYGGAGSPEWIFGATAMGGSISDLAMSRLEGGKGPFGGYQAPSGEASAGRLQIEWLTSARAVFWFSRAAAGRRGLELQPISMVRFDFGKSPGTGWTGRWLVESTDAGKLQSVEFADVVLDAGNFTLLGAAGEALHCESAPDRSHSPPSACELQFGDGRIWQFHDIGLGRMTGIDEQGNRVRATHLQP